MSGVTKAVGKVFKSVGKALKWVVPAVLAAGAIVFTAGAAIPAIGAIVGAGGWASAAATLTSTLGISTSTTLGSIVAGAITQAGTGAAIGALTSAITGGKISKGLSMGAAAGALTGGVLGAINGPVSAGTDITGAKAPVTPVSSGPLADIAGTPKAPLGGAAVSAPSISSAAPVAAQGAASTGRGFLGTLWDEAKHSEFAGGLIRGVGEGLIAKSNSDAELEALQQRDQRVADNYALSPTRNRGLPAPGYGSGVNPGVTATPARAPQQPLYTQNSREVTSEYRYTYDPVQRQLVKVPVARTV